MENNFKMVAKTLFGFEELLAKELKQLGAQAVKIFGDASFGIVSAILTILILVLTEIIPKTIGARYWRKLAKTTSFVIKAMIFITYPLVSITSIISKAISKNSKELTISREEISALASIGKDEGIFTKNEHKIIQNLLRLKNVKVREIMTPRVVVAVSSEELSLEDFSKSKEKTTKGTIYIIEGKTSQNEEIILTVANSTTRALLESIKKK